MQRVVADFGGDPQSVTVAGAGQGAVLAHLLSQQQTGSSLLHKLILQSGSSLCEGAVSLPYSTPRPRHPAPYTTYRRVLTATRCADLRCLRDAPLQQLLAAQQQIEVPYHVICLS